MSRRLVLAGLLLLSGFSASAQEAPEKLRIGVTLVPYYSFAANIVGDQAEVVPLIGTAFNVHGYQPQAEDIKRAMTLNALIVNGIGHDEWAFEILKAAGNRETLPIIHANDGVALFPVSGTADGTAILNPHTFIGIASVIPQVYAIAEKLGALDPPNAATYRSNARAYTMRLRQLKAKYMARLEGVDGLDFRCATVHGGYDYLLHEFGLTVSAVIEPNHGAKPSASQLRETIDKIRALDVAVIFSELDFPEDFVAAIEEATGVRVRHLSHLTATEYTPQAFEEGIERNMEALTSALLEAKASKP